MFSAGVPPRCRKTTCDVFLVNRRNASIVRVDDEGMSQLLDDQVGSAMTEYLLVLILVTLSAALTLYDMAPGVVEVFEARVTWLALPIP